MILKVETSTGPVVAWLNVAKPARQVPPGLKHKWNGSAPKRPGESATCSRCGCVKRIDRNMGDWLEYFTMPGGTDTTRRPDCPGTTA